MSHSYQRPPEPGPGLRLHLNENTGGCSPAVVEALRRIEATAMAVYPDYAEATAACAAHFGVDPDWCLLTNGLDEGILATSLATLCGSAAAGAEAVVVEPAFDMYAACVETVGGRVRVVAPRADLRFPVEAVRGAISAATRLVFLTNPNNPTGELIGRTAILELARAAPTGCLIFLDEAYAEFAGESFVEVLPRHRNVLIGRTFSKAHGLAALRIGALLAHPEVLAPIRRAIPPYSINGCATVALLAALADRDSVRRYVEETSRSRTLLYEACERLGLEYWPSAANFVLVRVGARVGDLVAGLAERGFIVRDRSGEPGCAGCLRVTTGVVAHTQACIAAMESLLCDG